MKLEKILICFLVTSSLLSQEQRTIEILQAGKSIRNSVEYPDANILQKENDLRVILFHDGAKIESDISYYYFNENSFKANGKVIFYQGDSLKLSSDYLEYDGKTKKATAYGNVIVTDPTSIMRAGKLNLNIKTKDIEITPEKESKVKVLTN